MRGIPGTMALAALLFCACGGGDDGGGGGGAGVPKAECATYKTTAEVEQKLIVPRCGKTGGCHGDTFQPKFTMASQVRGLWLDKPGQLLCQKDKYVNSASPGKSYVLAKTHVKGDMPTCPSGGSAGLPMPNLPEMRLNQAEADCLAWYVYEIAAGR